MTIAHIHSHHQPFYSVHTTGVHKLAAYAALYPPRMSLLDVSLMHGQSQPEAILTMKNPLCPWSNTFLETIVAHLAYEPVVCKQWLKTNCSSMAKIDLLSLVLTDLNW